MKKEILEGNNLIAEFMGYNVEFVNDERYFTLDDMLESLSDEELQYHSSWDWLMPVVRKIVLLCIKDDEEDGLFLSQYYDSILDKIPLAVIEDSYKVVVEFIKYYNKEK